MNELEVVEVKSLSVDFNDKAVQAMQHQHDELRKFVQSQMVKDVDYGTIPGTPKPSLYKSGAEKLCKIFQLGSRIVGDAQRLTEKEPPFVMYTYTIEIFHLPTGKAIAQCQASANSDEKKYKKTQISDLHNTLMKMAQKRAYVGATLIAVNASDLFTQDIEDLKGTGLISNAPADKPEEIDFDNYELKYGRNKGQQIKDQSHANLKGFIDWTVKGKITAPKVLEEAEVIKYYLYSYLPNKDQLKETDGPVPMWDDGEQLP